MIQIKPYFNYYQWLDWFDVAPLDPSEAIEALTLLILDVNDVATEALSVAAAAAAAASTAQAAADNAQSDVDTLTSVVAAANANIAAERHGRFTVWWDEATLVTGTKTLYRVAGMDYGVAAGAASLINNEMKSSFVCDLSNGGTLHILCLTNNGSGNMTVLIDGDVLGSVDLYTAVQTLNVDKTLSIGSGSYLSGRHTISIRSTSKHASSSGYALVITKVWFTDNNDV